MKAHEHLIFPQTESSLAKSGDYTPELDLAVHKGMRLSKQYGLTWDCVDLERKMLTIPASKHGKARYVRLNPVAIAALHTLLSRCNGQPWVFLNRFGQRLSGPREWFESAVEDAGIADFTWHCLRHSFANRLVVAGVGLRTVQELMGHKTIQVTARALIWIRHMSWLRWRSYAILRPDKTVERRVGRTAQLAPKLTLAIGRSQLNSQL